MKVAGLVQHYFVQSTIKTFALRQLSLSNNELTWFQEFEGLYEVQDNWKKDRTETNPLLCERSFMALIFRRLNENDRKSCSKVCKSWETILTDPVMEFILEPKIILNSIEFSSKGIYYLLNYSIPQRKALYNSRM